jgi:protein ImuA
MGPDFFASPEAYAMIEQLRRRLQALQKTAVLDGAPGCLPLGIAAIDAALGGGLARGALHEVAAVSEAHLAAATGFAVGLSALRDDARAANSSSPLPWGEVGSRSDPGEGLRPIESHLPPHPNPLPPGERESRRIRGTAKRHLVWLAEDMALAESGAPHGPGLDAFGLLPEQLLTVAVARPHDLLWAMEEALRCRAIDAVIGELRQSEIDMVILRRLSLAAADSGALALLLRAAPPTDTSTAATRWIVGATPSATASPRFTAQLTRNRRGPLGAWILEWSDSDERFLLATPAQPVAAPALDRPHRKVA